MPAIEARLRAEAHIAKGGVDPEQAELRRELEATRRTVTMLQTCIPIPPGRCNEFAAQVINVPAGRA
jgi:hypothetical protein